MNENNSNRYKLVSFLLVLVAIVCIVLGNTLFTLGTTQHILISLLVIALCFAAFLGMRLSRRG